MVCRNDPKMKANCLRVVGRVCRNVYLCAALEREPGHTAADGFVVGFEEATHVDGCFRQTRS